MKRLTRFLWVVPLLWLTGSNAVFAEVRLVEAVKAADQAAIRTLLTERVDVNTPEADGTTALHWAADGDNPELVELLIRAGADVNQADFTGRTPLAAAERSNSPSRRAVMEALTRAGGRR